jgi:hypothetical protein
MSHEDDVKNLTKKRIVHTNTYHMYQEAQLKIIREGYQEMINKIKEKEGLEPHWEHLMSDEKPN